MAKVIGLGVELLRINVFGINYEYNMRNIWTVTASVYVNGHLLLDKAVFKTPHEVTSFADAEKLLHKLLTEKVAE